MSVTRAVENRVSLARAANTGISALAAPDGSIIWQSDLYITAAHTEPLPLLSGGSFYTRYGDIFAWLSCGLAFWGWPGGWRWGRGGQDERIHI